MSVNYEKMTKDSLMNLCESKKIKYSKRMKKSEIIELIKTPLNKDDVKSEDITSEDIAKQSVILVLPTIQEYLKRIDGLILEKKKIESIEIAEKLKEYLLNYHFEGAEIFKEEIKNKIEKVLDTFDFTPPKKILYLYSDPSISIIDGKSEKPKLSITFKQFQSEIENPEFILRFSKSITNLMQYKISAYTEIKDRLEKELVVTEIKVKKLKASGTTDKTIEDMYPHFSTMKAFKLDIEDLISLVRRRINITQEDVKKNLIEAINNPEFGLSCIKGRLDIKNHICSQIYSFSKGYKTFVNSFNNIAIYGPSGSGKSYIAQIIAFVFSNIGILAKNNIKIVTKSDLVAHYVGQTASKTRAILIETLEGILFIDEAYQLSDYIGSKDFGKESLAEMINFIDKYIGLNIVIVAGYEDKMKYEFMNSNEGLPRRFPHVYILKPYTNTQLVDILIVNLVKKLPRDIKICKDIYNYIYSIVSKLNIESPEIFKNQAGDMLNLSSSLNKMIISSYKIQWSDKTSFSNKKKIVIEGFNDFLENKNMHILINN